MAAKYGIHQFSAGIAPLMGGLGKAVTGLPEQVQLKQYLLILRSFYLACSYSPPLVIASVAKQSGCLYELASGLSSSQRQKKFAVTIYGQLSDH